MGQFTKRLTRKKPQPTTTFTIPEPLLSMDWRRPGQDRVFRIRKLFGNEVDWTEDMILRSIARVGNRKLPSGDVRRWWRDIGPRARAGVRLCFYSVHQVDQP